MSRPLGLAVLRADYAGDRIPVMEHCRGASRAAIRHFSGIDPLQQPDRLNEAFRRLSDALEIDLLWGGGLPTLGRTETGRTSTLGGEDVFDWDDGGPTVRQTSYGLDVVQWGVFGAAHQEGGRHFVHIPKPASVDEALDFDPSRWFPRTIDQYRDAFTAELNAAKESCGDVCVPVPHHYTTAFHFPLAILGFELLCEAGMEEHRFHGLIERFAEISRRITTAWSQVPGLEAFICHDDLTMTSGPLFAPNWYREHIFPHYASIFAPLKAAGVPLIFTSDGDCTAFVDDIFAAGADGLNFEYLVDLRSLVERYPDKILIGNINSATVARGSLEALAAEVERCVRTGARAPRFVCNVGGGITHDMSPEALERYVGLRKRLCREARTR